MKQILLIDIDSKPQWGNIALLIYVLVGHLPFERDLEKLAVIKTAGHNGYVMRLPGVKKEEKYIRLAQWVNQHWTFEGFCIVKEKEKREHVR